MVHFGVPCAPADRHTCVQDCEGVLSVRNKLCSAQCLNCFLRESVPRRKVSDLKQTCWLWRALFLLCTRSRWFVSAFGVLRVSPHMAPPLPHSEVTSLKTLFIYLFWYWGLNPGTSLPSHRPQPVCVNFNHSFVLNTLGAPEHLVQPALVSSAVLASLPGRVACCSYSTVLLRAFRLFLALWPYGQCWLNASLSANMFWEVIWERVSL